MICYVNGHWELYCHASVHVEDRGFQFGDGVYEALAVKQGVIIDVREHLQRLENSLNNIKLAPPKALGVLPYLMREAVQRNHLREGLIYLQITRGQAKREHSFPNRAAPSLVIIARHLSAAARAKRQQGLHLISLPDERWGRCDIKSLNLLANVIAHQEAQEQEAQEAWLYDENGIITEGTASNAWIIKNETLITHKANHEILHGITHQKVMRLAQRLGLATSTQGFSLEEALTADEAFISSSIGGLIAVLSLDGMPLKAGKANKKAPK